MKKPRILLSGNPNQKLENYIAAVENVGGIADAKYLPELDGNYDGLIICGGSDIHPKYYGQEINGSVGIDSPRDECEFKLLRTYAEAGKPVLGICRGFQLINVFFGGTLHQHSDFAEHHTADSGTDLVHKIVAKENSLIATLYPKEHCVNSHHHQTINKIGNGFAVSAFSADDNVIEAIEHKTLPIIAVQWHPERMGFAFKRNDTADGSILFRHFIELCELFKNGG